MRDYNAHGNAARVLHREGRALLLSEGVSETRGQRLRRLRLRRGLSMDRLAEMTGFSKSLIQKHEADQVGYLHYPTLQKYAALYGVTPEYINTGEPVASDSAAGLGDEETDQFTDLLQQMEPAEREAFLEIGRAISKLRRKYQAEGFASTPRDAGEHTLSSLRDERRKTEPTSPGSEEETGDTAR